MKKADISKEDAMMADMGVDNKKGEDSKAGNPDTDPIFK